LNNNIILLAFANRIYEKNSEENEVVTLESIERMTVESHEMQSLKFMGLEKRYGLPICWAVSTACMTNQPKRLANLAVGE
jgi:hypothetical protein